MFWFKIQNRTQCRVKACTHRCREVVLSRSKEDTIHTAPARTGRISIPLLRAPTPLPALTLHPQWRMAEALPLCHLDVRTPFLSLLSVTKGTMTFPFTQRLFALLSLVLRGRGVRRRCWPT